MTDKETTISLSVSQMLDSHSIYTAPVMRSEANTNREQLEP